MEIQKHDPENCSSIKRITCYRNLNESTINSYKYNRS